MPAASTVRQQSPGAVPGLAASLLIRQPEPQQPQPRSFFTGLTIPTIPQGMVTSYNVVSAEGDTARLAQALIEFGVLSPSYWQGDLATTVYAGIETWASGLIHSISGSDDLACLDLSLYFTNDVVREIHFGGMQESDEEDEEPGARGALLNGVNPDRIGGFALLCDPKLAPCMVGHRVYDLEAICRGAGFAVLGLLDNALYSLLGCHTPAFAYTHLLLNHELDEDEEEVYLSLARFKKEMPAAAYAGRTNGRLLRRLAHIARNSSTSSGLGFSLLTEADRQAFIHAHALHEILTRVAKTSREGMNDLSDFDAGFGLTSWAPACLAWRRGDSITTYYDDYRYQSMRSESTNVCWLNTFGIRPESIQRGGLKPMRTSLQQLQDTLTVLAHCDVLMQVLHSEDQQEKPAPHRVRRAAQRRDLWYALQAEEQEEDERDEDSADEERAGRAGEALCTL